MTFYCRLHSDWEGADLGKICDHVENYHPELLGELKEGESPISVYRTRLRRLLKEDFFEVVGPNRLSDTQWLKNFSGRMPKMASQIGDNEKEK